MGKQQLTLPKMGESVSEATIIKWLKQPGDRIEEEEAVLEIATGRVDSEVPSPVAGVLKEQLFAEDTVVQVGAVLAVIETEGADESADPLRSSVTASAPANEPQAVPGPVAEEVAIPYVPAD